VTDRGSVAGLSGALLDGSASDLHAIIDTNSAGSKITSVRQRQPPLLHDIVTRAQQRCQLRCVHLDAAKARLRAARCTRALYEKAGLRIDFDAYEMFVDDRRIGLTLREFTLLRFFVASPNRALTREQILDGVWGANSRVGPRTIDVHIRRLRKRIERDSACPEFIVTVRGVGCKFDERTLAARAAAVGTINTQHAHTR